MAKVKITVVKAFSNEDVFGDDVPEYFPSSTPSQCGRHRPGEVFIIEGTNYPEGLCLWAFAARAPWISRSCFGEGTSTVG